MARRSETRGFASMDPERRRRIASEGGRSPRGGRGRDYVDEYDDDYEDEYDEDEDQGVSGRHRDRDEDEYGDDDDYEDSGYGDEDDDRRSRRGRGRSTSGRRASSSRRGFAGMDSQEQRRIARMGGEAVSDEYGPEFYSRIGRRGGRARWEEDDDDYDYRSSRSGSSSGGRRSFYGGRSSSNRNGSSSSGRRSTSSGRRSSSGRTGFGAMPREEVRRIARMGGRARWEGSSGTGRGRSRRSR